MIVYIIGITGVGKTTFGKALAERLKYHFIDLDEAITTCQKQSISSLFAADEQLFRAAETEALQSIDVADNSVVATGGGIITRAVNSDYMRDNGFVIYVKRSIEAIVATIDTTSRPLLEGDANKLYQLFDVRQSLYQDAAHFTVDITNLELALDQTVEEILSENSHH